ncbi:formate dehydrogenase accessory sulfurtransferase FdhD [Desulfosarcina sp. OttesenSCG-928-A07]|nr:formate dehydrogenase accessory sulfurtransferase FdhD [Desulfosarcina sp. OttesenSCG-928-G17]MDL2328297.1 formate dehydrogenase accessory sulfurtransferase FdhD [Desulfosarcina sp. OttesenSCG-928-A07]
MLPFTDHVQKPIRIIENGQIRFDAAPLINEAPLFIRIQRVPFTTILRTPGAEKAHAAGFCLGEGIVEEPNDISGIFLQYEGGACRVDMMLTPARYAWLTQPENPHLIFNPAHRHAAALDPTRYLSPAPDTMPIPAGEAVARLLGLNALQPLHRKTRASHGAAIYDRDFTVLATAEDVGRHNALDKAIGKIFLDDRLSLAHLLVLSSRISTELVQKAARAKIPVILGISRPTAMAVELADSLNITLATLGKDDALYVYCRPDRIE